MKNPILPEKGIVLNNRVEASFIEEALTEEGIPFYIKTFADGAYNGLFQVQFGWGQVMTDQQYRETVESILHDFRAGTAGTEE